MTGVKTRPLRRGDGRGSPKEDGRKRGGAQLKPGNQMKLVAERLFARLVPKQSAPRVGPANPAKESKLQQRQLKNPPRLVFRQRFIDAESSKSGEVDSGESGNDLGWTKWEVEEAAHGRGETAAG